MPIDISPRQLHTAVVFGLLFGLGSACHGDTENLPRFSLRGFGTLGGVYHNDEGTLFRRDIGQAGGARRDQVSLVQDSMLGAQLSLFLHEQFEITAQAISRLNTENNLNPQLTWGYVKYKPDEAVSLRIGRLGVDTYMQGDSAQIGYANLPIRQPITFYPRIFDGMDAEFNHPLGDGTLRLKGFGGWTQGKLIGSLSAGAVYDTGGSQFLGGIVEYALYGWTGRFSAGQLRMRNEIDTISPGSPELAALQMLPNGAQIIDVISQKNREINFQTLAASYDSGPLQGIFSFSFLESAQWPDRTLLYSHVGYRLGPVTPYISYSSQHGSRPFISSGLPSGPAFNAINQAALLAQSGVFVNQSDLIVGARYDFIDNMALKFQVDFMRYKDPESIIDADLLTQSADRWTTRSLTVFSLALDFVF
ncbi:MAG: hypothetical protein PHH11_04225 [Methylomonas sp.]|nr:hypothetical protein [Methylomonas sp.]